MAAFGFSEEGSFAATRGEKNFRRFLTDFPPTPRRSFRISAVLSLSRARANRRRNSSEATQAGGRYSEYSIYFRSFKAPASLLHFDLGANSSTGAETITGRFRRVYTHTERVWLLRRVI